MESGPYDPRAIANLILDFAGSASLALRHLALQKLLYFAHASFLVQRGRPLVTGAFEGWQHGPVHPAAYQAFKAAADRAVDFRATARNILTGESVVVEAPTNPDVRLHVMQIVSSYGRLSSSRLIDLTHAPGGPWHCVVHRPDGTIALGARITDAIIRERFARPVSTVTSVEVPESGEPQSEAEPPARYGCR